MKTKKNILIFALILLTPIASIACSCITEGTLIERRNLSALTFVGHVVSETVDSAQGIKKMKFAVHKMWHYGKRANAKWRWVETSLEPSLCGFNTNSGKRSIIFASKKKELGKTTFQTNLCSGNIVEPTKLQVDSLRVKQEKKNS